MKFEIDTGIAIPARTRTGAPSKYPLAELPVGGSFFVPNAKPSLPTTLGKTAKALNIKITTRTVVEKVNGEEVKGMRVWRAEGTSSNRDE